MPLEPTYGEKAVGLSFNPSGDPDVDKAKRLCAQLIDLCDLKRSLETGERARLFSIAIAELQTAQMWVVKALTFKDGD